MSSVSVTDLWFCGLIGIAVTAGLFVVTDYYTSTRFRPVKTIARASITGHATNIIQGLAQGFQGTAIPALIIILAIFGANELAGIYGIAIAVMAQLSLTGLIVALDAFGPITDNAGGIAEMADLTAGGPRRHRPARRGRQHDEGRHQGLRDRLGRARRAGPVRRVQDRGRGGGRTSSISFDISNPEVLIGLLVGGMMTYLFAALAIEAVGRAGGEVVEQVRKQFREQPGIMEGTEKPDYGGTVAIVTAAAQREMILPVADPDRRSR